MGVDILSPLSATRCNGRLQRISATRRRLTARPTTFTSEMTSINQSFFDFVATRHCGRHKLLRKPQKTRPCQGDPRPSLITELRLTCKAALRVLLSLRLLAETLYSYSAFKVLISPSSAETFQLASEKNSLSSNINIIQRAVHLLFEFFVSFIGGAHSSVPVAWGNPRRLYGTSPANPSGLTGVPCAIF